MLFSCVSCTEKGKVLKVLHAIEGAFIIAQYSLFHDDSPVINMAIDSKKVQTHIFNDVNSLKQANNFSLQW